MSNTFVNASKQSLERKIKEMEDLLPQLKEALITRRYLDYEVCQNCGTSGIKNVHKEDEHGDPYISGTAPCDCSFGVKRAYRFRTEINL